LAISQQHLRSAGQAGEIRTVRRQPADVIELILADHRRIRRLCEALEDAARWSGETGRDWMLADIWQRLASILEAHARAEEEVCYAPMLWCDPGSASQRRASIADHDEIREAISEAFLQHTGSRLWCGAVRAVLETTVEHIDLEERTLLTDWLPRLTMSRRRELGRQWAAFIAAWKLDAAPGLSRPVSAGQAAGGLQLPARHWRIAQV
jgi:Hemerythrin HHE cation binding domain